MRRPSHIKALLAERGLTQIEAARQLGLSPEVLNGALNQGPTWPKLRRRLAELLEVDEVELFPEYAKPPTGSAA